MNFIAKGPALRYVDMVTYNYYFKVFVLFISIISF